MNLFKKTAVFTDLHVGLKSNSAQHNNDCESFVDWVIANAKANGCETCMFLGDWHHHRASINIQSLHYSIRLLEKLNSAFSQVFFIPGNHDLYYRDRRDIHSVEWIKHLPNVTLLNDWLIEGDCVFAPWLVGDEHKKLQKLKGKYLFGHFELPNFYMNAMVQMPDHGGINEKNLINFETVFSGHFHKRQKRNNIWYIGNAFPHNYADAGDKDRGMMILEWDKEPEFYAWPDQPLYNVHKLSDILESPDKLLPPNSHIRVHLDIDISYEEASFIKETLIPQYKLREMSLIPMKLDEHSQDSTPDNMKFESVDQVVVDQISAIESDFYDPKLLLELYNNL